MGRKAEAAAQRRAVVRCAKGLAAPSALAAYATLLVDLARPRLLTGAFAPPRLSHPELRLADALLELLVRARTVYYKRVFGCGFCGGEGHMRYSTFKSAFFFLRALPLHLRCA